MIMEDFKQIITETQVSDWNKRLKSIESLVEFTRKQSQIISRSGGKFVQLIDSFCKLLGDNNIKVQSSAQTQFL